jgi:hypothetical protein
MNLWEKAGARPRPIMRVRYVREEMKTRRLNAEKALELMGVDVTNGNKTALRQCAKEGWNYKGWRWALEVAMPHERIHHSMKWVFTLVSMPDDE